MVEGTKQKTALLEKSGGGLSTGGRGSREMKGTIKQSIIILMGI